MKCLHLRFIKNKENNNIPVTQVNLFSVVKPLHKPFTTVRLELKNQFFEK